MLNELLSMLLAGIPVCIGVCVVLVLMQRMRFPAFFFGLFGLAAGLYMAAIVSFYMDVERFIDGEAYGMMKLIPVALKSPVLIMEHLKRSLELYHVGKWTLSNLICEIGMYAAPALVGGVFGCLCCFLLKKHCWDDEDGVAVGVYSAGFTFPFYVALAVITLILMLLFVALDSLISDIAGIILVWIIVGALCCGGGGIIIEILIHK